jgi:hypothetical protein
MRNRRRDYATHLSDAEQQTLALLQARIPAGLDTAEALPMAAATRSPRWRGMAYLSTAAVVIAVTAGSALVATLSRPDPGGPPAATTSQLIPAYGVDELVTTLDRSATSAGTAGPAHRRSLSVVVARRTDGCRVSTVAVDASAISAPARALLAGRLTITPAELPRAVPECAATITDPPQPDGRARYDSPVDDLGGAWLELAGRDNRLARSPGPLGAAAALRRAGDGSLVTATREAGTFDRAVSKMCAALDVDCAALTWTVAAELLSDPTITPERRAVAVRQAGTATAVPSVRSDLTGRAGVTLRVPYLVAGREGFAGVRRTTAELTFDRQTGSLLQLTSRDATGDRTEAIILEP